MAARKPATSSEGKTQLEQLAAEFGGGSVKARSQGGKTLTYIAIDKTIQRLNEVLGPNWGIEDAHTAVIDPTTGQVLTQLTLVATIDGVTKKAYGIGADKATDLDKAAKTALAEALKKACHQLGIALYLWDEEARDRAEQRMKLDKSRDSEATLKKAVFEIAKKKLGKATPTAAEVAGAFGVSAGDLSDKAQLVEILEAEGVL